MQKHIYGLAATFDHISWIDSKKKAEYFRLSNVDIQYGRLVALTVAHDPKQTITTTDTGELILVQTETGLYFRYTPTTEEGFRMYRYVKNRRLKQCSCIYAYMDKKRDRELEQKMNRNYPGILNGEQVYKADGLLYEICLTSSPKNQNTFCTVHQDDPRLTGIEWVHNIQHSDIDGWGLYVESEQFKEELKEYEESFKRLDQQIEKLLKRHKELEERQ